MKAEQVLTKAINALTSWKDELDPASNEELIVNAEINILAYGLAHVNDRQLPHVRNAIALAYAVLGNQENQL